MLLPVLKPAGWAGLDADLLAHRWIGTADHPSIVVAYARHGAGRRDFVTGSEGRERGDAVVEEAFANLGRCSAGLQVIDADGHRLLLSLGGLMTTERILLQDHVLAAHDRLEADELVVAIPRPGLVVIADRWAERPVRRTLRATHRRALAETAPDRTLLPELLVVADGRPSGLLAVDQPWVTAIRPLAPAPAPPTAHAA